jgi:predicted HAD superfamily Cof-like phosphohydrolase
VNTEELRAAYGERATKDRPQNSYERVVEFMETFGHPVYDEPTLIKDTLWEVMRLELIREEFCELLDALGYEDAANDIRAVYLNPDEEYPLKRNLVGAADALGDLEYVTNGMAAGMGIPLPEVVEEIHRSNMTKLGPDGKPIYREDGKILKGADYEPPRLEAVLFKD